MSEGPDLFGQVPVTWPEVVDWCARVAGITPDSPRFIPYVRAWNVVEKIAAARAWEAFEANSKRAGKPLKKSNCERAGIGARCDQPRHLVRAAAFRPIAA